MARKRWKRKSGHVSPRSDISKKDMIKYDLFLDIFYNDWEDWRDGFRDWFGDSKLIKKIPWSDWFKEEVEKRLRMNRKQKMLLRRRKKMKSRGV